MNKLDSVRIQMIIGELLTERFDIPPDKITNDSSLRNLGLDSMLMLDVMLEMETRLGIKLKDLAIPANPTLGNIVALIERNIAAAV